MSGIHLPNSDRNTELLSNSRLKTSGNPCHYFSNQKGQTIKNIAMNRQSHFKLILFSRLSNLTSIFKVSSPVPSIFDSLHAHLLLKVVAMQWLNLASPSMKHFSILDLSTLNTLSLSLSVELWVSSTFPWKWWFNVWIIWLLGWVSGKQCNICNVEADGLEELKQSGWFLALLLMLCQLFLRPIIQSCLLPSNNNNNIFHLTLHLSPEDFKELCKHSLALYEVGR